MRQGKLTAAYKTLMGLYRTPGLPFRISQALYLAKHKLQPYYEAQAEKQRVILEASGQTPEGGQYKMTPDIRKAYAEILDTEIEWTDAPVEIRITDDDAKAMGITGEILDILDGLIIFAEVSDA